MIAAWSEASEAEDYDRASRLSAEILDYVGEHADWENDPDLRLAMEASCCEQAGDWEGAERAYEQSLHRSDCPFGCVRAHWDLASLHRLLNRDEDEMHHLQLALANSRQQDSEVTLATALQRLVWALLPRGKQSECEPLLQERRATLPDETTYEHLRASADIAYAAWLTTTGATLAAQELLSSSYQVLKKTCVSWCSWRHRRPLRVALGECRTSGASGPPRRSPHVVG